MQRVLLSMIFAGLAASAVCAQNVAPEEAPPSPVMPAPSPPAAAPEQGVIPPGTPRSRFQFSRVRDAILRMDGETGQIALCSPRSVGWACQAAPEDRAALETEIARLQTENRELRELAERQVKAPPEKPPETVPPGKSGELKLPSHEELERARAFIEHAWRRLVEMIENLQKDIQRKG